MASILSAVSLRKSFGGVKAVDGISMDVEEGERLAVVGPNGSGKTTLINLLSGLLKPDSGDIYFKGIRVTNKPLHARVKLGIARSFQLPSLYQGLTVRQNAAIAVSALRGFSLRPVDEEDVRDALERFGLWEKRDLPVGSLSEGEKKILDIALAVVARPKVFLLDEPTSSIAEENKFELMEFVVGRLKGVSLVIVEHDLDIVEAFADRVAVMHSGRITAVVPPGEVRRMAV